mmetsp:Transcript_3096/g.5770  ORF Transcript_3096/g.5770 Transcript_3096/m.5770 type:complete len:367 (-) Transcript_3096:28-1128(-)
MIGKLICIMMQLMTILLLASMFTMKFAGAFCRYSSTTTTSSSSCGRIKRLAFQSPIQKKTIFSCIPRSATTTPSSSDQNDESAPDVLIVDKMPPPLPLNLRNKYYLLRHGQSEGNVEGVISSSRSLKYSSKHGLTPLGYQQGYDSAKSLLELIQQSIIQQEKDTNTATPTPTRVFFYSSPFARAKQTAQACIDGLLSSIPSNEEIMNQNGQNNTIVNLLQDKIMLDIQTDILLKDGLMERYFGQLDGLPLSTYAYVWPEDKNNVTYSGRFNVESVAAVATRLRELLLEIDHSDLHNGGQPQQEDIIVLTSHADVLQILQLYASGIDNVGEFSSYRFGNGEVRFMGRTTDTLPDPCPLEIPADLPGV